MRVTRRVNQLRVAFILVAFGCVSSASEAQVSTRVDLDNDAFNFWQAPNARADREYTQGISATVLWPTRSGIARRLLGGGATCATAPGIRDCRTMSIALSQTIYTPTLDFRRRVVGERPYAGWLGAEIGVQHERESGMSSFSLALGVVGKASLAEATQKVMHRLLQLRQPEGWNAQLPNEPGLLVTYRGAQELFRVIPSRGVQLSLAPVWELRAGNVATDATLGVHLLFGVNPATAWKTPGTAPAGRWGVYGRAGASQTAVVHSVFLDGSTFSASQGVEKRSLVAQGEFALGVRLPIGVVEWRTQHRQREYDQQPRPHAYSTISFWLH
jgi:lipid A 3-O-deacylase